jgi:hypothetical protein
MIAHTLLRLMFAVMEVLWTIVVIDVYFALTLLQDVNNVALQEEEALYVLQETPKYQTALLQLAITIKDVLLAITIMQFLLGIKLHLTSSSNAQMTETTFLLV